jgi:hypothetical protein
VLDPTGISVAPKGGPPIAPGWRWVRVFCSYAPGISFRAASLLGKSRTRGGGTCPLYRGLPNSDVHFCTSLTRAARH